MINLVTHDSSQIWNPSFILKKNFQSGHWRSPRVCVGRAHIPEWKSVCVCVGLSWVGSCLKFCLRCCGPPNGKVFDAPFLITPPCPLPAHAHTRQGVGMICRFRCFATLLPILASFRHRQHFLPLSSTPGTDGEEGGSRARKHWRYYIPNVEVNSVILLKYEALKWKNFHKICRKLANIEINILKVLFFSIFLLTLSNFNL